MIRSLLNTSHFLQKWKKKSILNLNLNIQTIKLKQNKSQVQTK